MPVTDTRHKSRMTYDQAFGINGNTPPQAVSLEESVLGALMLDQAALINAIETLHVEYFYKPEHQAIYRAIRKLFEQSQPVDMLTVVERLRLAEQAWETGLRKWQDFIQRIRSSIQ